MSHSPAPPFPTKISVILIKPSKYDDDGYVLRYRKGFLPSNTLACLSALTEEVRQRGTIATPESWKISILDDTVQPIHVARLTRQVGRPGHVTIVGLVGVQSNQFPRASDLALAFTKAGAKVLIGGFHVSGCYAMFGSPSPEIEQLLRAGVTVVAGEVEGQWEEILRDAVNGTLRSVYNFLNNPPQLYGQPGPAVDTKYLRRFITSDFATVDCSRGCPFHCSFCTIINVQGRKMRCREPRTLLDLVRHNFSEHNVFHYFLTDDNFARNPNWEEIFDGFIRLREEEQIPVEFMMQVDVLSYRIKNFIPKARRAGCTQVFIGMESLNPKNLAAAQKNQNDVRDLENLIAAYHNEDIMTHAAYIVGFPFDTVSSVHEDVEALAHRLGVRQASFFMLTPLPGSRDHQELVSRCAPLDPDLNRYDAGHATMPHPRMTPQEWALAYRDAWETFYGMRSMRHILSMTTAGRYWNVFKNLLWARSAIMIERDHPMLVGLFRRKERVSRRAGFPVDSVWRHSVKRWREIYLKGRAWMKLLLEMEELWLATRVRTEREIAILDEIRMLRSDVNQWRELRTKELQEAYRRAFQRLSGLPHAATMRFRVPSRLSLVLRKMNVLHDHVSCSRQYLTAFWKQCLQDIKRGRVYRILPHRILANAFAEIRLILLFAYAMLGTGIR